MSNPLVSVIIPVYNAENFIEQTIQSVLNQTIQDFEIIVLNDGSKDNSGAVIQALQKQDNRIIYISKSNSGVSDTRNKGIEKAKGKYLAFLDADDIWKKDNLEKKLAGLDSTNKRWIFSDHESIDESNNLLPQIDYKLSEQNILDRLLLWEKEIVLPGPCSNIVAEKSLFDEGVKFDITLSSPADRDISIQLASKADPALIHEKLWQYRIHAQSMSNQNLKVAQEVIVFINKMKKSNLYKNNTIRKKSLSNLYYMLAGYFNANGYKMKGIRYLSIAFFLSPANVIRKKF